MQAVLFAISTNWHATQQESAFFGIVSVGGGGLFSVIIWFQCNSLYKVSVVNIGFLSIVLCIAEGNQIIQGHWDWLSAGDAPDHHFTKVIWTIDVQLGSVTYAIGKNGVVKELVGMESRSEMFETDWVSVCVSEWDVNGEMIQVCMAGMNLTSGTERCVGRLRMD